MKKLFSVILILILILPLSLLAAGENIFDNAEILGNTASLQTEIDRAKREHNTDIVVVTVDTTGSKSTMEYADDFYDENGYGTDGILFLISLNDCKWYISTSGKCIDIFSDADIQDIGAYAASSLSSGAYLNATVKFAVQVNEALDNYYSDGSANSARTDKKSGFEYVKWIGIAVAAGFVVAIITVSVMKGKLKSVKHNKFARDYILRDSFELTRHEDIFLYSTVSRVEKPESNSSSHSTHMSSGGHSHGGGGGSF